MKRFELVNSLNSLAGWFRLQVGGTLTPEGKQNCALVCEEAAAQLNIPAFSYKDAEILTDYRDSGNRPNTLVDLWYVQGLPDRFYPTKIVAEQAARITFPHDEDNGYGRIYYKRFVEAD